MNYKKRLLAVVIGISLMFSFSVIPAQKIKANGDDVTKKKK